MKTRIIALVAVVIFLPVSQVQATEDMYGGGTGIPNDPYLIYTAEQMNAIGADSNDWDKHFKLMADIDLSVFTGTAFNIIGTPYPYRPFTGVFDGSGHIISNFSYTSTHRDYVGLFGYIRGQIKDLGLIAPDVDAGTGDNVGSLVGWLRGGTITGCYVEGSSVLGYESVGGLVGKNGGTSSHPRQLVPLSAPSTIINSYSSGSVLGYESVGGLVGVNVDGTISNCYSTGSVSGIHSVGGLVGYNGCGKSTITNCYSSGDVLGYGYVGGLVGDNMDGTISNCYSSGDVLGHSLVGGLVGHNRYGTITNCYSSGSVLGHSLVGGLVGHNRYGTITNCYSSGSVLGYESVGGLVGGNGENCTITNCYSTGTVSGIHFVGGLVGYNGCGKSTITNCYSTGTVSGIHSVGGLVGWDWGCGTVTNSFWDIETSGQTTSAGGTGLPTDEMQMASTFTDAGWDFTTPIWKMCDGPGYPRLSWEQCPIEAEIDINPNTLNLKSKGKWITCYIWLPEDYDVAEIDPETILLEQRVKANWAWFNEQQQVAMAKFSRSELAPILETGELELTVTGRLVDGTYFSGMDTIRVIDKRHKND